LSVSGDRLDLFGAVLEVTPDFLVGDAKLWSLGEGCLYHRNRKSTRASTLRTRHAQVNLPPHKLRGGRCRGRRAVGTAGQFTW
jgi:hypothetical protein